MSLSEYEWLREQDRLHDANIVIIRKVLGDFWYAGCWDDYSWVDCSPCGGHINVLVDEGDIVIIYENPVCGKGQEQTHISLSDPSYREKVQNKVRFLFQEMEKYYE